MPRKTKQAKSKLTNAIKVLSLFQVLLYLWALQIFYTTRDSEGYEGLAVFVPYALFAFIGVINLMLYVVHIAKVYKKKQKHDKVVTILITTLVLLVLVFTSIAEAIS